MKHTRILQTLINKFFLENYIKNLEILKAESFTWQGLTAMKLLFLYPYKNFFFSRGMQG